MSENHKPLSVVDWLGADNKIGIDIWEQKYRFDGESFEEWLDRISNGNESLKQKIVEKKFLFGGRILSNRGLHKRGYRITLTNCFLLGEVEDTLESIFKTAGDMARTYSAGGGCGVNLGLLRPNGSKVHNNAKFSTGVVPFMEMYSKVTETIGQNNRRGALMITLPVDHPDIEEFIKSKANLTSILKANISVFMTDKFMRAVENDQNFLLRFYVEQTGETIEKEIRAKELFRMLSFQAWDTAEPGLLFKDRIQKYNIMSEVPEYVISGTNP